MSVHIPMTDPLVSEARLSRAAATARQLALGIGLSAAVAIVAELAARVGAGVAGIGPQRMDGYLHDLHLGLPRSGEPGPGPSGAGADSGYGETAPAPDRDAAGDPNPAPRNGHPRAKN